MKVGSFNVRGLGGEVKKDRRLVVEEKLEFIDLHETKVQEVFVLLCSSLWGVNNFGYCFLPAEGCSGGIISIWNFDLGKLVFSFSRKGFVGACLEWDGVDKRIYVINVYSQGNVQEKRQLWENILMSYRGFGDGLWCVVSDFNVVRCPVERKGVSGVVGTEAGLQTTDFNQFIENMDLSDIPLLGRKYTWYRSNGIVMSRLDRFLLSGSWLVQWGNISQWAIKRDVSDHCPVVLRYDDLNWGPKPFKFKNFWLKHLEFGELVKNCWAESNTHRWMGFVMSQKLKKLK